MGVDLERPAGRLAEAVGARAAAMDIAADMFGFIATVRRMADAQLFNKLPLDGTICKKKLQSP